MSDNITNLHKDPVPNMIGPKISGHSVIIDGRAIPNMTLRDNGDRIEFVLDNRYSYEFPREWAYLAAAFAAEAMAIGAGHSHISQPHNSSKAFAPQCIGIEIIGDGNKPA